MQQQKNSPRQKKVIVIGSGIMGVCSAYFLTAAGHHVTVLEQRGHVAELSTLGNSCIVSRGAALPWGGPTMRKQLLASLFRQVGSTILHARFDPALWRWIRSWLAESDTYQYQQRTVKMHRLAHYSQSLLAQIQTHFQLDFEQRAGLLRLFRCEEELTAQAEIWNKITDISLLDHAAVCKLEPALAKTEKLAGGLHFADVGSGNCALFTKQLKIILQEHGVPFYFNSLVTTIEPNRSEVNLCINGQTQSADAVVCATGHSSVNLLQSLGLKLPMYAIKTYMATAAIKNYEAAANSALIDDQHRITITRLGSRIRVTGIAEFGAHDLTFNNKALNSLLEIVQDWLPDAANFNRAHFWCGHVPMFVDELPLIGRVGSSNVFVNIPHGGSGWSMALGAAKILADQISGYTPEIDMDGLTPARYQ